MTTYIGLDFETTGLDPLKHLPLTLGLAWETEEGIKSHEFGFQLPHGHKWDVEAMFVNKLALHVYPTNDDTLDGFLDSNDWKICQFLMEQGWSPFEKSLVPVGWNVGGFDMRFMQTFFPQASKFFSHRYLELNSIVWACERIINFNESSAKELCKQYAESKTDSPNWHNAEWDAIASLYSLEYLTKLLEDGAM